MKSEANERHFPWRWLALVMAVAVVGRALLVASGSVGFHGDEAVVALMARHILAGARPVFFYGQAYMGSLDAWWLALGFSAFGQTILSIRIMQSALYLLFVGLGFMLAWRLSGRRWLAPAAGLLLALPTVNLALYTTATLGGYGEMLVLGTLALLVGHDLRAGERLPRWALVGLVGGVGWWTNGLIVAFGLPLVLWLLWGMRGQPVGKAALSLGVAALGFVIGSGPWWLYNLQNEWAALVAYLPGGDWQVANVPLAERVLGLLLFGLPAALGLRFPWSGTYFLPPIGLAVMLLGLLVAYRLVRGDNPLRPGGRWLTLGMIGLFLLIFASTAQGADPTGRYLVVLALPLALLFAALVEMLARRSAWLAAGMLALMVGYQTAGVIAAAQGDIGLTTQFDVEASHLTHDHDQALMAFLTDNDLTRGYTNYWVAMRFAFLSEEHLQYASALPYKADLSYNPFDNRYPPYAAATQAAERVAFITTYPPPLNEALRALFAEQGLTYREQVIGPYRIFYEFAPGRPAFMDWAGVTR